MGVDPSKQFRVRFIFSNAIETGEVGNNNHGFIEE